MNIPWKKSETDIAALNDMNRTGMAEHLDIQFTEIGQDYLKATMPVTDMTRQPFGYLHGGASAAFAETVGSVASWLTIDREKEICMGMELNCNHIRGKKDGVVTATASPLHIGSATHVWDIKIVDENGNLICVSRLTVAVVKKRI